jgi:hypothetical protein
MQLVVVMSTQGQPKTLYKIDSILTFRPVTFIRESLLLGLTFVLYFLHCPVQQNFLHLQCLHMSLMDFVISPPVCGRSVTDF